MGHLIYFLSKLEKREIIKIIKLVINSFIAGILEIISLASLIPVLHVVLNSDQKQSESNLFGNLFIYIDSYLPQLNNIFYACFLFIIIFVIKNTFIFLFFRSHVRFAKYLEVKFSYHIIDMCTKKDFNFFLKKKKSEFLTIFSDEIAMATRNYVGPLLILFTEVITLICFLIAFIFWGQFNLILIFIFYFFFGILILRIISKISKKIGFTRADTTEKKFFLLNNIFSNIRYLILENKRSYFFGLLKSQVEKLAEVHKKFMIMTILPKILMELVAIISILTIIIYLNSIKYNINEIIILSGLFLMATYRIVPSFNKIIGSYNQLIYASHAMQKVFFENEELDKNEDYSKISEDEYNEDLKFQTSLELKNVNFSYPSNGSNVLENVNLKINKGHKIGVFGYSGAGKSTLVDIISTLNRPTKGQILIDNKPLSNRSSFRAWQNQISYVSQNSVLLDDTIQNNITFFDKEGLDKKKLENSIRNTQLKEFIETLPNGINTSVGDLGNQLSGGQIQRIAIARALYKDKDLLILDEPTSALDENNEKKIIENLLSQKKTIILISHNLENLKKCDFIYEIKDKKILSIKI